MKNNNEMEDNMEKYIEKKAIECLMRTLRNKKEFSIEEIIKIFSDDIKNTEASINKIIIVITNAIKVIPFCFIQNSILS